MSLINFIPPFPTYISPALSQEDYKNKKREEAQLLESILEYLANKEQKVQSSRMKAIPAPCGNKALELGANFFCNLKQIFLDTICCGYGSCWTDPDPAYPTYLTEREYRSLNAARINLNRNTCALFCVGPMISCGVPLAIHAPSALTIGLAILSGMSGLMITGCMTYFWGDSGERELEAFEYLQTGFEKTADYLENKWKQMATPDREEYRSKIEQMAMNCDYMILGMTNRGIHESHAQKIIEPFAEVLRNIRYNQLN
ncbi:hypothetical protein [Candidatus Protochlamydia phocaeensis]|uniref:hypothetical protein n=1 Tax=Candidatus Protochlamydia phocaeensis TaxID=1414722 RepID=UPI00083843E5|nr:hypothetical protein [Candidatus Protochlamydia phocaeensis]